MRERVEGPGKYIKAKTYLMRMINNTTAMYLNLGLLDFIKIAITYMNIYVFSHNGKQSAVNLFLNLVSNLMISQMFVGVGQSQ